MIKKLRELGIFTQINDVSSISYFHSQLYICTYIKPVINPVAEVPGACSALDAALRRSDQHRAAPELWRNWLQAHRRVEVLRHLEHSGINNLLEHAVFNLMSELLSRVSST